MIVKKSKISVEQWGDYQRFYKGVRTDQGQYPPLSETGGDQPATVSENNPEAEQLIYRAYEAMRTHHLNAAGDLLAQVERLNPKQSLLWAYRAFVETSSGNTDKAIADYRKEIEYHPGRTRAVSGSLKLLISLGRRDEAIDVYRNALSTKPDDESFARNAASLLMAARRYAEIPAVLEKPIAAAPDKFYLQALRAEALLRSGKKDQGVEEAQKDREGKL